MRSKKTTIAEPEIEAGNKFEDLESAFDEGIRDPSDLLAKGGLPAVPTMRGRNGHERLTEYWLNTIEEALASGVNPEIVTIFVKELASLKQRPASATKETTTILVTDSGIKIPMKLIEGLGAHHFKPGTELEIATKSKRGGGVRYLILSAIGDEETED